MNVPLSSPQLSQYVCRTPRKNPCKIPRLDFWEEEINIRRLKEERKQQRQKQSFQIMRKEAERSLGLGKWELNTTRTGDAS